ncbi:DUF2225 domain-containing protein [Treponema sp.]|uniref:DUF2225 domain-containing protein n=1 Tax=Treponema sp. TaxID=166 RepID=UPI003FA265A5
MNYENPLQPPKKEAAISYYSKEQIECPVCGAKFKREEMYSGGGRVIAGDLTDELRRLYEPSAKYGEVHPLIYSMTVCPKCLYAGFTQDFRIVDKATAEKLLEKMDQRHTAVNGLFGRVDFNNARTLHEGAAAYYLALLCYDEFDEKFSPTIKQAICALRAAWLFSTLGEKEPEENYTYISKLFYQKALFLYRRALELETTGKEMIAGLKSFGPDVDKNYGYDGVIYLGALLEYRYGQKADMEMRLKRLSTHKISLAKLFGLGKSSKNKPGPILEHARTLYDSLKAELHETDDD